MKRGMLITGAASGGGFEVARFFAKNGWNVALTSRNRDSACEAARKIAEEYGVISLGYGLKMGDEQNTAEIFADLDKAGVFAETVVFYAADLGFGTDPAKGMDFLTVPIEEVRAVFETNLTGNFIIARQAALRMKREGKGAFVFMGSNTSVRAIPNRSAYCASKGGINALSKALAVDLGRYGIRSNVILSGTIKTERWRNMDESVRISGSLTPLGDITDYEDIANAVWFLGTDLSKNVTGSELALDGGMSCQLKP